MDICQIKLESVQVKHNYKKCLEDVRCPTVISCSALYSCTVNNVNTNLGVPTQRTVVKPSASNDDSINSVHSSVKNIAK